MSTAKKDTKKTQKAESTDVRDEMAKQFRSALVQTSWRVAVSILGCSFLGIWLDGLFDTKPVLSIAGITLGLVLTFVIVRRHVEAAYPGTFGGKK